MTVKLSNTLTKQKDDFIPISEKKITMYACGPTVYDRAHIGNARAIVIFDTLFRLLRLEYGENNVVYARNITDVDDKINTAARERSISIQELTEKTTQMFHDDMDELNCLHPTIEPRATTHIPEMIDMITRLIDSKHAYEAKNHVLFRVKSDANYGHLSRRSIEDMVAGSRVEIAPFKEDPMDFVLWKPSDQDEPGWDSPWGRGRPGWHIECSAMSTKYLGETFDIHAGGADLQFPHHENEIAQSCCANPGSKFAKYWVHNGFLTVEGEKMSKSLGNFVTVNDLLVDQNIRGEVVRCALLSTHYKKPLDWNTKAVSDAQKTMDNFYNAVKFADDNKGEVPEKFLHALRDDLNTPLAFSELHSLVGQINKANGAERALLASSLRKSANLIGLLKQDPAKWLSSEISSEEETQIAKLIEDRKNARLDKNWAESDRIRAELTSMNITVKDNPDGTTSWVKG